MGPWGAIRCRVVTEKPPEPGSLPLAHAPPVPPRPPEADGGDGVTSLPLRRNPVVRGVFVALGWASVVLGAIGVVVPGWPTTVWILVAVYFFARSSPRFHGWIMGHRLFGPLIRDWHAGLGLTARTKFVAVTSLALSIGTSIVLIANPWITMILLTIAVAVASYLLTRPTKPSTT